MYIGTKSAMRGGSEWIFPGIFGKIRKSYHHHQSNHSKDRKILSWLIWLVEMRWDGVTWNILVNIRNSFHSELPLRIGLPVRKGNSCKNLETKVALWAAKMDEIDQSYAPWLRNPLVYAYLSLTKTSSHFRSCARRSKHQPANGAAACRLIFASFQN